MRKLFLGLVALSLLGTVGCRGDESRCTDLCEMLDDCAGADIDVDNCIEECVNDAENADDKCLESFEATADCSSEVDNDCGDFDDDCEDEGEDFLDDCDEDFEDTFEEIGLIPGGGGECGDTCAFAYDGYCDEPDLCSPGTDSWDCGSC